MSDTSRVFQNLKLAYCMHLTITPDGMISLWDSEELAMTGKMKDETYLQLPLTNNQVEILITAKHKIGAFAS